MGYGTIYGDRTISRLIESEVKYLDRLFVKALANTSFGKKVNEKNFIIGKDVDRLEGAETLYQQIGRFLFGDNEFSFRKFSDANEYNMNSIELQRVPLLIATEKVVEKLCGSLDKALIEIEKRCTHLDVKSGASYKNAEFRNGAWQLYAQIKKLIPDLLPTMRDRRTIKRRFASQKEKLSLSELVLSKYQKTLSFYFS